jgi:hypothetical protein
MDDVERGLRLAATALVADATANVSDADATRGFRSIHGASDGTFTYRVTIHVQRVADSPPPSPPTSDVCNTSGPVPKL